MSEERKPVATTKGLWQLKALLKKKTQKVLGAETGILQSVLSEISNRKRLPTLEQAVKLSAEGIEPSAWTELAGDPEGAADPAKDVA
jgi:hypothetical protein